MKKGILKTVLTQVFILIALLSFNTAKSQASEGYEIKFKVKGAKDTIQLAYYFGSKKLLRDTAVANAKGEFVFDGKKKLKGGIYLVVIPGKGYFDFVANDNQFFSMESDTADLIQNMKVKDNQENSDFYEYLKVINPKRKQSGDWTNDYNNLESDSTKDNTKELADLKKHIIDLNNEINDFQDKFVNDHPDYFICKLFEAMKEIDVPLMEDIPAAERKQHRFNYYKKHYFDNMNLSDDRFLRTPIFEGKFEKYMTELTLQQCDSVKKEIDRVISLTNGNYEMFKWMLQWAHRNYEKSKIMCMDCIFLHIAETYYLKDERCNKWINEETMKKIEEESIKRKYNQCGDVARNMCFKDTNDVETCLRDVNNEYVLLYFWSATCGHCKKTTPVLHELYKEIKDKYDFEVYSVCIDKDPKPFYKYIKEHKLEFKVLRGPDNEDNYRVMYNVFSTPQIYLLDSSKKIIAKRIDVKTIEKIIMEENERKNK